MLTASGGELFSVIRQSDGSEGQTIRIIMRYGEANEKNETDFSFDVNRLLSQVEIKAKHTLENRKGTTLAVDIATDKVGQKDKSVSVQIAIQSGHLCHIRRTV